jgi:hypothetical protein
MPVKNRTFVPVVAPIALALVCQGVTVAHAETSVSLPGSAATSPAQPPEVPPESTGLPPGYHQHDSFFARATVGPAYVHGGYSMNGQDADIYGAGMGLAFALGGVIARNLVLYGETVVTGAIKPKESGMSFSSKDAAGAFLVGFGPGLAYYLEPSNVSLSGTVTLARMRRDEGSGGYYDSSGNYQSGIQSTDMTDFGVGVAFTAAKECWVSANWALGVGALFYLAGMPMKGYDSYMVAEAGSILFAVTFN